MRNYLCAALTFGLVFCLNSPLVARTENKRVPTEQEDLQMLYDASVQQKKAMKKMLKQSEVLLEDYKKNPQKYQKSNTIKRKAAKVNADGIPIQNLNADSAGSIQPSQKVQPQITQKQLDELLENVKKMQKGVERRNKALEKFE